MQKTIIVSMLALTTGLGFSVTASAQSVSCGDLVWTDTALEINPNIAEHCIEVVERNGQQMAKMHARVVRQGVNSTVVQWQRPDGSWSPSERRYPDRGFLANVGGKEVRISDLPKSQEVNVYVAAENNFSVPAAAPIAAAAPAVAAAAPEPAPEPEPAPAMLPSTATQVPALALLGGLLVLLGGAVSFVRSRL